MTGLTRGLEKIYYNAPTPYHALAGAESVALLTSHTENWILYTVPWIWETSILGFLNEPSQDNTNYVRRVTGGPVWNGRGGRNPLYSVLIGPRMGKRPLRLGQVYKLAREITGIEREKGPLQAPCRGSEIVVAPGKLVQRPFIEIMGSEECITELLLLEGLDYREEELDSSLVRNDSIERLSSRKWLDPKPSRPVTLRRTYEASDGFKLILEAIVEEAPVISWFRLYGDFYLYPPAQARLLIDQVEGAPVSRVAALELLNAWGTLVEQVGYPFGELRDAVIDFFTILEDLVYR